MCNCRNSSGFVESLKNANKLEQKTNKKHAVYVLNKTAFVGEVSAVKKVDGICCYFLSDGTEVLIEKKSNTVKEEKTATEKK